MAYDPTTQMYTFTNPDGTTWTAPAVDPNTRAWDWQTGQWLSPSQPSASMQQLAAVNANDANMDTTLLDLYNNVGWGGLTSDQQGQLQAQLESRNRALTGESVLGAEFGQGAGGQTNGFYAGTGAGTGTGSGMGGLGGLDVGTSRDVTAAGLGNPYAAIPSATMNGLLSGTPNNQYLDQIESAMRDNAVRATLEGVMPGIRAGATATGMLGSSRQGIAEGLAMSRMNQDLAQQIASMRGSALENAQNRMASTANNLAGLGTQQSIAQMNAQNQVALANQANRLNWGQLGLAQQLGLGNLDLNRQQVANQYALGMGNLGLNRDYFNLNATGQALNWLNAPNTATQQMYNTAGNIGTNYQTAPWQQLNNMSNVTMQGVGSQTSQPLYTNPTANTVGSALTGYTIGQGIANNMPNWNAVYNPGIGYGSAGSVAPYSVVSDGRGGYVPPI